MQQTKGFSSNTYSKATIIAQTGAVVGGAFAGYYSQFLGRRATIMIATLCGAAFIPLWVIPTSFSALVAGAFFIQFCVQGAWGVIPIHLNELAPPQFRASFPGISYQIGNMISSPMAQIMSVISEGWHIYVRGADGKLEERPDYGKTEAIMMTIIFILTCFVTACGGEARGSKFELAGVAGEEARPVGKSVEESEEGGKPTGQQVELDERAPSATLEK